MATTKLEVTLSHDELMLVLSSILSNECVENLDIAGGILSSRSYDHFRKKIDGRAGIESLLKRLRTAHDLVCTEHV